MSHAPALLLPRNVKRPRCRDPVPEMPGRTGVPGKSDRDTPQNHPGGTLGAATNFVATGRDRPGVKRVC